MAVKILLKSEVLVKTSFQC